MDLTSGAFYGNMTFALAKVWLDGHTADASMWACRDNGSGDSLGTDLCGGGGYHNYYPGPPDPSHPTFKRLVEWLKNNRPDIKITVSTGKSERGTKHKILTLSKYLSWHKKLKVKK